MVFVISILIFSAVSVTIALAFTHAHGIVFGDRRRIRERVANEFRVKKEPAASAVFKNLDRIGFDRPTANDQSETGMRFRLQEIKARLQWLIERSDLKVTVRQVVGVSAILAGVFGLTGWLTISFLLGFGLAFAGGALPVMVLRHHCNARRAKFLGHPIVR